VSVETSFPRLTVLALAAVFVLMISGTWLAQSGAGEACSGWPMCSGGLPVSPAAWLAFAHRLLTLGSGILIAAVYFQAWKKAYHQPLILVGATGVGLLFLGQVMVGALKVSRGYPLDLIALHAATSAALWSVLVLTTTAALVSPLHSPEASTQRSAGLFRLKAFFMLNKPVIVLLLLVTTYAGMVAAASRFLVFG